MPTKLADVENSDREISLQFSFASQEPIPQFLNDLTKETEETSAERKARGAAGTGVDLSQGQFKGKMVDLRALPAELLQTNYVLVGVWKQERLNPNAKIWQNTQYWMIRFRFRHRDHLADYRAKIGEPAWQEIENNRTVWTGEFVSICSLAFWQIRAYRNPWYQNGNILPGVHCISLNFEGRKPLYEWEPPKSMGDEDLPEACKPDFVLHINT